ncbi:MAG: GTP-binding protein [Lautropia sp.]|nr:GTP-binding protein [Lautropia sp.]
MNREALAQDGSVQAASAPQGAPVEQAAGAAGDTRTPLTVLTGFLGAGKTTVLKKLLAHEQAGDIAVLINEFGEVGIDQQLVTALSPDVVLLDSGCVCCQIRGELKDCLLDLLDRRARGELPPFRRVVMETTGLAEPTPILATLMTDPVLSHQFRMAGVWTVVDALHADTMASAGEPVWVHQLTAADRVLLTKADLLMPGQLDGLQAMLSTWVPGVPVMPMGLADALPALTDRVGYDGNAPSALAATMQARQGLKRDEGDREESLSAIQSLSIEADQPVDWTAFGVWLSALLHRHGRSVLRVKGILNIGERVPVLVNGVQHMIHPPEHLPGWGARQPRSQLVLIFRDLDRQRVEASFRRWVLGDE